MDLYINSAGVISGAGNNMSDDFLAEAKKYETCFLQADEPDYKAFIPVMQLRRMSKAVRMGVVASKVAMQQANIEKPDAVSIGTAYGCLQDTEKFLGKMIEQEEQMLTPTAFIQSTHNTVGGQVALLAGCNGHNMTYVHRGHSFEHALINTALYLQDHAGELMLVGGIDEQTGNSVKALQQSGKITTSPLSNEQVLTGDNDAAVAGEGAAFFVVTQQPVSKKYIHVKEVEVFKADVDNAVTKVQQFVERIGLKPDLLMLGDNGSKRYGSFYTSLKGEVYPDINHVMFKGLCGDYPVASSFALAMLNAAVQEGKLPDFINADLSTVKNVVLVNNFGDYYSCWLLTLAI